jgi:long-chain acyl-CoA synthetase
MNVQSSSVLFIKRRTIQAERAVSHIGDAPKFTTGGGIVSSQSRPEGGVAQGMSGAGYHLCVHALKYPSKPAVIMGESGQTITYAELDALSNRVAQLVRSRGLRIGDAVAICLENHPLYLALAWGVERAGLVYVPLSYRLTVPELAYILQDSSSKLLFGYEDLAPMLEEVQSLSPSVVQLRFGGKRTLDLDAALAAMPDTPIADQRAGIEMIYSSGTTGRPKGVDWGLPLNPAIDAAHWMADMSASLFGQDENSVYLSPAPLYHAAPLRCSMATQRLGGTVVVMEKFDPEMALSLIEKYRITDSQWVPTHFIRLLALPEQVRRKYDISSLKSAVHAAAPCPVPVKRAMIEWWGPAILEYYAATEGHGVTFIRSDDWLAHPGSVGRATVGVLHICDDNGDEVPPRTDGQVFFEAGRPFSYHNDPEKTCEARNKHGWTTVGDIGWVDEEGYLYLTDRKSFLIISGGVNIYPQEIENLIIMHPKVLDVAVIGAPDPEMGERVVAVVQPKNMAQAGAALAEEIAAWLGPQLSRVKMPRQIDFREELPREPTGKLLKRKLRDEYRAAAKP